MHPSGSTASSATSTRSRWSVWTVRSTSAACPTSTRRRCSRRCSTSSAAAHFQLAPVLDGAARKQLYLPDTNVLLTRSLDDRASPRCPTSCRWRRWRQAHNLVRRAKCVRGEVPFRMRCAPRFDYGRATHTVERRSDTEVLFVGRGGPASWRSVSAPRCRSGSRTAMPWRSSHCAPRTRRGSCSRWRARERRRRARSRTTRTRRSRTR